MSGSRDDLVLLQSDERLWPRPWPAAGTPVHIYNGEKSSFWRVCEFSRGNVSAIARVQGQTVSPMVKLWKVVQGRELDAHKKRTGRRLIPVRISWQVLCTDFNPVREVFALETSLAFSELRAFVSTPRTLAQAEAGRKQGLFYHFIDRKLEHIQIEGAIHEPKYKHLLPL